MTLRETIFTQLELIPHDPDDVFIDFQMIKTAAFG